MISLPVHNSSAPRIGIAATVLAFAAVLTGCSQSMDAGDAPSAPVDADNAPSAASAPSESVTVLEDGSQFIVRIVEPGSGEAAAAGDLVRVHYTGWLFDPSADGNRGSRFDSSRDRGMPFQFPLAAGRVIAGWDQGVEGMQIGETRELIIPPSMGYGQRGAGDVIPPGATLYFEVELLGVN